MLQIILIAILIDFFFPELKDIIFLIILFFFFNPIVIIILVIKLDDESIWD